MTEMTTINYMWPDNRLTDNNCQESCKVTHHVWMDGGGGSAGRGDETLQLSVIIESSSAPRHQNPFFN